MELGSLKIKLKNYISILATWLEHHLRFCLFLYFAGFALGLIGTANILAVYLTTAPITPLPGVIYYIPQTQIKLIAYALSIPTVFMLCGVFLLLVQTRLKKQITIRPSAKEIVLQFLWGALLLIAIAHIRQLWQAALVLCLFFIPFGKYTAPIFTIKRMRVLLRFKGTYLILFTVLFTGLLIHFGTVFGNFVFKPLQINNEFLDISSLYTKTSPAKNNSLTIHLPDLQQAQCMPTQADYSSYIQQIDSARSTLFMPTKDTLCLLQPLSDGFLFLLNKQVTPTDYDALQVLNKQFQQTHNSSLSAFLPPHIEAFMADNLYQYHWQILSRGFLHHHNHLFGSAHQFLLGRPLHEIFMQYGLLQTILVGKILALTGDFSYARYMRLYYSFYFVYFALFLYALWILLKNKWYVLTGGILIFSGWLFQTYLYLYLGPGTNPARYFMYLSVVLCIFEYIKQKQSAYMLGALFSTWFAIGLNTHFGLFVAIALSGVLLIKIITGKNARVRRFDIFTLIALVIGSAYITKLVSIGAEPVAQYFFSGLLGFEFSYSVIMYYFAATMVCYGLLIWKWKDNNPLNYALLFMTFFSQGVFIYYLRSAGFYHFCAICSIFVLQGLLALFIAVQGVSRKWQKAITCLLVLSSVFIWTRGQVNFHKKAKEAKNYFKTHQLYEWDLPHTGFFSTMNPADFKPAVSLVNRYKTGRGIYLLSQYDNFLPLLTDTYNRLPFIDTQWYLTTQKELDAVISTLKQNKPSVLFVETGLAQNNPFSQIIPPDYPLIGYLHDESLWRAQRLNLMKDIFRAVQNDYELVERGDLISIYKRKSSTTELP